MDQHVTATFANARRARYAAAELVDSGFDRDRISLMIRGDEEGEVTEIGKESRADQGATAGGVLGALAGGLIAVASLAVPGGIFVTGPFWAALGGAAAGAAGGGLVGALVGAGIPEEHARDYERRIEAGEVLLGVDAVTEPQAIEARRILEESGATSAPAIIDRAVVTGH